MSNNYKIIIFGNKIYREYELQSENDSIVKVGTNKSCKVRFSKEVFFNNFEFEFTKTIKGWQINCVDGVYFTQDGVMKVYSKELIHGDELTVKYEGSNAEIFKINFFIDFDSIEKNYDREIDIENINNINIGRNTQCDIYIDDSLLENDYISLSYNDGNYYINDNNTKYGVYVNGVKIIDKSKLNSYDFIMFVGYSFYLKDNRLYTTTNSIVNIKNLEYRDLNNQATNFKYPKFNRSTRIKYEVPQESIEILDPEALPDKPKSNIILTLIPALAMLGLTVVLRGVMGGGGSFVIYSVCSMSLGIIMSVVGMISEKRQYKKQVEERKVKYKRYIEVKEEDIRVQRKNELNVLEKIYKPLEENIENVERFSKELFDREPEHNDFLSVRIGSGISQANCKVTTKKQEVISITDDLLLIPKEIEEKYRYIDNAPVFLNLAMCNLVGIIGNREKLYDLLKNITLDIAIRQYYSDVKLFYMFKEEDKNKFAWIRWLRHVRNENIEARNMIFDEESKNILFEYLYLELSRREETLGNRNSTNFKEHYVIFVFDNKGIYTHPISKYLAISNMLGFTFIFFEEHEEMLPKGCNKIIRLDDVENKGLCISSENGEEQALFKYNDISDGIAEEIAIKLASIYIDKVSLESQLTKSISLFELLNIISVDDLDLKNRWEESQVYKSMAAPLGVKTKNEIVYLDLNEKNHGPHGLVAGTTGSGKSEILQSYILSMSTIFHPYEVGFVIIDFKGGGMVNQFKDLPHLIGAITNIDGREIDRSLLSIKAELRKRQERFAESGVNHIDAYIKKYKSGEVKEPLPHLIIIVDEFAELKSEYPDFMKELISAARIGRSLGVHLILATQKPSGVVDDQIWSNSKFKLCLKVQTKEDSNEVIKTPLAAEIKEPGRAYLQVGNNEIFELFQSAYSGANAENEEIDNVKEFTVNKVSLAGKRIPVYIQKKKKGKENSLTQLEVIVNYINNYCQSNNIINLPGICLPSLEESISYTKFRTTNVVGIEIAIGIYDDPSHQLQDRVRLDLTSGNTFIVGSSQYGKTNLLQTIIRGLADGYSPAEVNIYILDFASMILRSLSDLNHVGGVVTSSEDEKMKNFIKMINTEIAYRKEKLSKAGISSFSSYKEAGFKDLPQIVVIIDNFIGFRELYMQYDDDFLNICREGISVGISIIITTLQTTGIGYKYLSNFANKIGLYCNDSSEYGSIFDRCRMQPKNVPGRGLIELDKVIYEYQTYLGFEGEKEIDRVRNMKAFVENINKEYINIKAKQIPEIPKVLTSNYISNNFNVNTLKPYEISIGLDYDTVDLVTINLMDIGYFTLLSKENSNRINLLRIIMNYCQMNIFKYPSRVYVFDNVQRDLKDFNDYGFVERYSIDSNEYETIFEDISNELEDRYLNVMESGIESLEEEPLIIIIINNRTILENMGTNKNAMDIFKTMTNKYKSMKVSFMFTDVDNAQVSYSSPEIMKLLKENKKGFIFENIGEVKFFEVPNNYIREHKKNIELGDSYLISNNEISKVKTITES